MEQLRYSDIKYIIWHGGTIAWNYGLSFPLGMIIARNKNLDENKAKRVKVGILIISFVAVVLLLPVPHEKFIKFFFTLSCAVLVYNILTALRIKEINPLHKVLEGIGKQSYFMYLNESFIIGVLKLRGGVPLNALIVVLCSYICAYVMRCIYELVRKNLMKDFSCGKR